MKMEIVIVTRVCVMDVNRDMEEERRGVPTHQSAALEISVHLEVEGTVGEIRPVSSVLLESSRQ